MNPPTPNPTSSTLGAMLARIVMGLTFLVFGLNGFLQFMPQPKTMPPGVIGFMTGAMQTHYFLPLIFATQLLVGILLLINRFVPLALALIAPVVVNIILYHLFLWPETIAPGVVVLVLEIYLAYSYRACYRPMLAARTTPS